MALGGSGAAPQRRRRLSQAFPPLTQVLAASERSVVRERGARTRKPPSGPAAFFSRDQEKHPGPRTAAPTPSPEVSAGTWAPHLPSSPPNGGPPGCTAPPSLAGEGPGMSSFIGTREKKAFHCDTHSLRPKPFPARRWEVPGRRWDLLNGRRGAEPQRGGGARPPTRRWAEPGPRPNGRGKTRPLRRCRLPPRLAPLAGTKNSQVMTRTAKKSNPLHKQTQSNTKQNTIFVCYIFKSRNKERTSGS